MENHKIGARVGKNEKNMHTFQITYRDQGKDFDWPDIKGTFDCD